MRKVIILILTLIIVGAAYGQKDLFMPPTAVTMAQGGAFTAVGTGYNAFFYNPAGFARKEEFTLLSFDVWGIMDRTLYDLMADSLKSYTGTNYRGLSGGARAFDTSSIISQTDINSLNSNVSPIVSYLNSPGASGSVSAAFSAVSTSSAYASLFANANVTVPTSFTDISQILPLLAPVIAKDPALVTSFLSSFVTTVGTMSGTMAAASAVGGNITAIGIVINDVNNNLIKQFPSGNANVGAIAGIGYVGKGAGIGLFAQVNADIYTPEGKSMLSSIGRVSDAITLAGGIGFNLWDGFSLGFAIRPTIIGYTNVTSSTIMAAIPGLAGPNSGDVFSSLFSNGIYKGFYIGIDVGALWDIGTFTLGLVVKDLIPYQIAYNRYSDPMLYLQDLINFKGATYDSSTYQVPWGKINIGVSWHPDLGSTSKIIDPRINLDIHDILGFLRFSDKDISNSLQTSKLLNYINVGAEINLLGFIALRGGFNQGAWTAGLGIKLYIMEINAAFSAKYKDGFTSLSDYSEVGFSLEVALLRI